MIFLDTGFRDVRQHLQNKYGLITKMPTCSQGKLTTLEANYTRLVTKWRWLIEVLNGSFKSHFKSLSEKCRNKQLPLIIDDYRIASALINCFHSIWISDKNDQKEIGLKNVSSALLGYSSTPASG